MDICASDQIFLCAVARVGDLGSGNVSVIFQFESFFVLINSLRVLTFFVSRISTVKMCRFESSLSSRQLSANVDIEEIGRRGVA